MLAIRLGFLASALAPLALASSALFPAEVRAPVEDAVAIERLATEQAELDLAAQNWTWYGCISFGSNCYDVYQDSKGALWVCLACGTTNNPNPGKCRKLTSYEIANALWSALGDEGEPQAVREAAYGGLKGIFDVNPDAEASPDKDKRFNYADKKDDRDAAIKKWGTLVQAVN